MANTAPISGVLKDASGQVWSRAAWRAVPTNPSVVGPFVYLDGTAVPPAFFGSVDAGGNFSGSIGLTSQMLPAGTSLTFYLSSLTSAPTEVVSNVVTAASIDLGALLSPFLGPIAIASAPLVYAYSAAEILNPEAGSGYINTSTNTQYLYTGGQWTAVAGGSQIIQSANQAAAIAASAANPNNFYFWV